MTFIPPSCGISEINAQAKISTRLASLFGAILYFAPISFAIGHVTMMAIVLFIIAAIVPIEVPMDVDIKQHIKNTPDIKNVTGMTSNSKIQLMVGRLPLPDFSFAYQFFIFPHILFLFF